MSANQFSATAAFRNAGGGRGRRKCLSDFMLEALEPGENAAWTPVGIRRAGNAAGAMRQFFKDNNAKGQTFYALRATSSSERVLQQLASSLRQDRETATQSAHVQLPEHSA